MPKSLLGSGSVPERVSAIRYDQPNSVALSRGDDELSYLELDVRADQFAFHLLRLGIGQGHTVALCLERSFDWIIAALGIMRAGAAYVPLDSAWPDARLRFAVNDSGASAVVARDVLLDRLLVSAVGIDPGRDKRAIAQAPQGQIGKIDSDTLAYVIYTSGSTGTPKGVEITHGNLAHLIDWHCEEFKITQLDRVSHLLGLGFDAAVLEVWAHLCAGATLCFIDETTRKSPELIQKWMVRESLTVGIVPAVHGASMIRMTWPATTRLRLLVSGGDVLHFGPVAGLPFVVVNNYGPTECTVVSTWAVLDPGEEGPPPIGAPIAGASVYLLNDQGQQVDPGETGEMYIAGPGVGRGYRNLQHITEKFFLRDPFATASNARMYRTGDLAKRRPDGKLQFKGRLDRQVKILGNRIELDEIDHLLSRHPNLAFAAVTVNDQENAENQLVAYVMPKQNTVVPTVRELQTYLLQDLPECMVPEIFVRLSETPLSPNGKINFSMLPKLSNENRLDIVGELDQSNSIEERLLIMAQELIKSETISTEDNFFLVGGHSLLAMQLLMRLRQLYDVDLTLQELFQAPTVKRMAQLVEAKIVFSIGEMSDEDAESQLTQ